jgi:ATPases with chaperone activity, ATP-binding subunit
VWKSEKAALQGTAQVREALDRARLELEAARRAGDLGRMAELQYGRIPELEKRLASAEASEDGTSSLVRNKVTEEEIAEVVSKWTGIPVAKMLEGEREKLLRMEEALGRRVVGQQEALRIVADAIRRSRAGLSDPRRPTGSFLFLGPTGVGKTELCKALAEFMFDTEEAMVRIDMSEFMEKHSVARLIGAPPGYVGYEEGGHLTEAVRRHPYAVILLDEIEKAHPDVFNVLLQVLEDGRLTEAKGRTIDFRNTVVIMTSNAGAENLKNDGGLGFRPSGEEVRFEAMKEKIMSEVKHTFRPEFLNRIDDIIVFHSLTADDLKEIVGIMIARLDERLKENSLEIQVTPEAKALLAKNGYDPQFGARPLRRTIQRMLEDPLSEALLSGEVKPGQRLRVDVAQGEERLTFTVIETPAPSAPVESVHS